MKTVASMTLALVATTAFAKPILWYHFDEEPVGTKAEAGVAGAIVNAANPGTLNGTVRGVNWDGTTLNSKCYLFYTNTLDEVTTWTDPRTGKKGDTTGMFVNFSAPEYGKGDSGLVTVPDDASLHLNQFTVELFFREVKGVTFYSGPMPIIQLYNSASNTVAWQLALGKYYNKVVVTTQTPEGAKTSKELTSASFPAGLWHHLAMTYDGKYMRVYLNYALIGKMTCSVEYAKDVSTSLLAIGNNYRAKNYRYQGWIDEVRLCDEVLTEDQFLRPMPRLCDEDTLVYVSGKNMGLADFGGFGTTSNLNEVWKGLAVVPKALPDAATGRLPSVEEEVPSAQVKDSLFSTNLLVNATSLFFETNAAAATPGRTACLAIQDVVDRRHTLLTNDELTVEFFFRASPQAPDCATEKYLVGCHVTSNGQQTVRIRTDGKITWAFRDDDEPRVREVTSKNSVRDGAWHHLAFVSDRTRRECAYYLDHVCEGVQTNFVMDVTGYYGSDGYTKYFVFGAARSLNNQTNFRGWMDEIRITRRALKPSEFLSTQDAPEITQVAGKQVLFYAPFDTDAAAYPFPEDATGTVVKCELDTVNRPLEVIAARADMGLATTNVASLFATVGSVTYDDAVTLLSLAGCKSLTIEFYANVPDDKDLTPLVSFQGERVAFEVSKASDGLLTVRLRTDKMPVGTYMRFDTTKLKRRSWHHYAVTLERKVVEDEVVTEVRAYVDHEEVAVAPGETTNRYPGEIPANLTGMKLRLGKAGQAGTAGWGSLTGAIDEVRITEGVLGVENFLDLCPSIGVLLMFR